jgi:hypothetical protein
MTNQISNDKQLAGELAKLPKEITPRRDLWPGIEAKLKPRAGDAVKVTRFGDWRSRAVAATVLVAFAAGMMLGRQTGNNGDTPVRAPAPDYALMGALAASEREYQAAFREFIPVGYARPYLADGDLESIETSWDDLRLAETALLSALQEYPDHPLLNQRLLGLRGQQLDFMKQLATLDQNTRRNT